MGARRVSDKCSLKDYIKSIAIISLIFSFSCVYDLYYGLILSIGSFLFFLLIYFIPSNVQKAIMFSFTIALPFLFICRFNEKVGYIISGCVFVLCLCCYSIDGFYKEFIDILKGLFELIKERFPTILKILFFIILFGSLVLNLILFNERKGLQKQIPHLAGIGGDLIEKPKAISNPRTEADYVNNYCEGFIEYVLPDKTRVDCIYNGYAIEFDWAKKWAESIGQSLYYAKMTGLKPAVAIIMNTPEDEKYIKRIQTVNEDITIFRIKAYESNNKLQTLSN